MERRDELLQVMVGSLDVALQVMGAMVAELAASETGNADRLIRRLEGKVKDPQGLVATLCARYAPQGETDPWDVS